MAKINVFRDRNGNVIYQRPTLTPSTKKAEDLLKKTAQKAPKIDTSPRNYGKPVTEKVQIVDYQSPIDTSPRNYGRPLTNKPHLGLYDDEKSLSNVTLGDVTYKPLLSGYYGQRMNEAIGVNRLAGNTNMNTPQIAKYQGLAQKYEPTRFSNPNAPFGGALNNAPQGALSLIGQQAANLTDEDTVMYAGTGAAAGAMIGSVAGLPGSAISATSGLTAGIAAGVGKNMFEAVYGGTYRDLMDAGVSDSTAHKTALISAGVQSALEMAQLDELAKAAKLLRKQNKTVLAEGIEKILIDRGKGVLKNTAEEVAQEVVAMSGEHYAKSKEGLPTDSWQDNVKRAGQTAIDSALSFGLMSLPGAVSTGNQALQYDKDQKRAQEYIDSLKVAMIKNGITPRSEQPQGTLGPLAAQAANQTPLNSTLITPQDLGNAAIADAKNNWTPGQVRYQNNLYTPPGREKTMTAERKEQSRRQAIQYAKRANIDIVFRDLEEGEGHFEGKFEQYDGKNILNPKGRITINNNSYDPFRVVFIHEFTHAMELSKEHYNKYANFAIVNLLPYKYGTNDIAELADAKAKFYASQGVRLTSEEARQEIVSELTSEYMFRDYQAIENLFRYNENIFYWMFENIKNWAKSFAGTQEEQDLARAYKLYARVLKEHQKRPNIVKAAQESDADNDNAQNAAQEGDTQAAASYPLTGESVETNNTVPYSGISNDADFSVNRSVPSGNDINYSPDGAMMFDEGSIGEIVKSDTNKDLGGKEAIAKFSMKDSSGKQLSVDPDINAIKDQLTMNFNMTPEQLDAAAAAIESIDKIDVDKGDAKNKAARERFKVIAQAFQRKYIKETEVDLVGSKFEKTEDLAMMFQVFRNPLFETNRYIFTRTDPVTKKKSIVMQTGVSSRLPGSSLIASNKRKYDFGGMYFNEIQKMAIASGADSFYVMHNHPSGNPNPSKADLEATAKMIRSINLDFGGHIIINSNKYALISFNDDKTAIKSEIFDLPSIKKDELLTPSIPHASLNDKFFSPEDLAEIAKKTQMDEEISVLIMATPDNTVKGLIEIRSDLYKEADFLEKIEKQAKNFGSHVVVLVTYDKWMYDFAKNNIEQGYFFDSLLLDKKNPEVIDSGRMYYDFPDELWMGKDTGKVEAIDIWPGDAYIPEEYTQFSIKKDENEKLPDLGGKEAIAKFSLRELPKVTAHPFLEDDLWSEQTEKRKEAIIELIRENPRFSIDNKIIVGYSPKEPGRYQVTYLDKNGEPLGDSQRDFDDLVMDIQIMRDKDVDVVDDYKVPDVKFSMKDSTGKQLSQKQQEFFKDSKARDENGSLLVMYHGTPHGEFEAFDAYGGNFGLFGQGIYTTDELSVAIGYSNKKVRGKDAKPHVYKLYVNIENPINMDEKADSKLWNKKLKDYNMDDIKITDSMTNTDAWNEVLDYLADGFTSQSEAESTAGDLIRDMGYDGITHQGGIRIGNKKHRVFIAFEPEQIKTIDNENPTEDARMKFSLKEPVEKTKDLIAAHNLTIDNMMKTLDLGGLPAASIAVAKADMGHSEFGEISVLFYPDTIDGKKNKANKVFAGDAWTQTFPQISQKVSKQAHERLEKRINSLLAGDDKYKDLGYLNLSYDGVQGEIDRWDSFERAYRNSYLMKLAYLRDTGKEFKPVMMEKNFIEDKPVMKAMLQIIGADKAKEWMDKDEMMSYEPKIREAINKYYESVAPGMTRYDEPMTWAEIDRIIDSLRKYASYVENGSPKVIDTRKTEAKFDKAVNMKAYTKWLESISEGLIEKQGVRNSKDPYTNNGRRTWDQLHDDATLENITKAMTSKDLTGNSFSGSTKFAAGVKKQLGSISDIKKNKDLIKDVSDEEIEAIRDDIDKRLIELVDTVSGNNNDSLFARDGVIDSLLDVALKGKTRDGIKRRLMATQYGNIDKSKLTDKVVYDFVQLIQDAQAVPTRYFEAKPQRAIGLDEIAMVVIPKKGTKELRAALDARGISYKMYDGTAEDRIAKINGVPDVKFSLKKADAKNIARKLKADYGSKSTIKDISQELTEIYDMDVNDMMAVNQRIEDLAAKIAENVPTVNEFEQRIKEFRQAVRNMPIRVDDNIKADIADFNAWSKRYFNRLNLSADGRNIDELYGSLAEQFPEFLGRDIDNPTDQLMAIADALDTTRQDKGSSNNEDMMYDILLDIYDDYYRYQTDEQAKAAEEPELEPGDDGPGNNGPTDDGDAYGDYDGDTSLARIDVWEHTEPEDRSPYFEKGENPARDINVPQRDEYGRKVSRFTRTAAESRALDDKQASELNESVWNGTFSYNVITDQDAINRANDKMERFDNDTLLNGLESKLYDSKIITKDDIALGERLIQEYAKEKNVDSLERAIAVVATAGTRAGQAVQAMRLLKKLSPAGQLMALQKQIDTINTDMKLLGDNKVTLSPERAKDITSSDTPEGLEQAVERAKMELYNKVPSRFVDKWNAWRYLSMLGNPKTHIRNMFGNAIFVPVRGMKNVIGATIEAATVKGERSKAIGKLPKIFKEFAAKEFDENKEAIDAGGKENIERNKRVFKSSLLEGMRKANSFALEAEDQKFLKAAYVRSFAGYLKANKISPALVQKLMSGKGTDIDIGDAATAKIFNNARAYAMNEAQKATYRDYSALANALNKFKKTNAVTAVLGEGLMPFTKTPINILKRGVEYSPVGILKGIKELANDVRKADDDMKQQTIIKGIDSMASGLSGTAILALGAFLASQGVLSGGGEEDKKERDMAAMMGSQNYSFNIGDVSYTVDWMAPVSLPLFVGVELFNSLESGTVNGFVDIADAMTSISEPMVNMSMLQGLNRAVTNYDQKDALTSTATEMALGYFSQGVPTLSGQIARTMDATRRTAYVDKNNDIPDTLERPMQNAMAKVPGLSKKLNPYRDSFGRPQTNDSALMRAFENFISPGYIKVKKDDKVLDALQKVYEKTGDKGVLPSLPSKKVGEKNLNAKEYDRMAYVKGDVAYRLVEDIIDTPVYREMDYTDKAKMISDAYDYAYAKAKDVVIGKAPDGWIAKAFEAAKDDIKPETYIAYRSYKNSLPDDMYESEKNRQTRELLFEDENLKTKDKNRLDDFLFNDGMYIPKDIKVDYENRESFEITQTSETSQKKWNQVKSLGVDLESYQVVYDIYYKQGIKKNQKIQMAIDAGLTPGQAYGMWDRLYKKKYR